jgi:hypothetical protein
VLQPIVQSMKESFEALLINKAQIFRLLYLQWKR